jgi:hypothetical protein
MIRKNLKNKWTNNKNDWNCTAGAKSIDITLNSKNGGNFKLYLIKIDATIGGQLKKDNTITYNIVF